MAAIEFYLHQQGNDPGEGGVECNHYKSNSEGEEEVETLVACERFMEVVNTARSWGRGVGRDGTAGIEYETGSERNKTLYTTWHTRQVHAKLPHRSTDSGTLGYVHLGYQMQKEAQCIQSVQTGLPIICVLLYAAFHWPHSLHTPRYTPYKAMLTSSPGGGPTQPLHYRYVQLLIGGHWGVMAIRTE